MMNWVYAVFMCVNGVCHVDGRNSSSPVTLYDTLEACRAAKTESRVPNVEFRCFRKPDWTDAEEAR